EKRIGSDLSETIGSEDVRGSAATVLRAGQTASSWRYRENRRNSVVTDDACYLFGETPFVDDVWAPHRWPYVPTGGCIFEARADQFQRGTHLLSGVRHADEVSNELGGKLNDGTVEFRNQCRSERINATPRELLHELRHSIGGGDSHCGVDAT